MIDQSPRRPAGTVDEKKPDAVAQIRSAIAPYSGAPVEEGAPDGLIGELLKEEQRAEEQAKADYHKMVRDIAGGKRVEKAHAKRTQAAAGKTAGELGADVEVCREVFALAKIVATEPALRQREKILVDEREALKTRHEEQARRMHAESDEKREAHNSLLAEIEEVLRARDKLVRLRGRGNRENEIIARMRVLGAQRQVLQIRANLDGTPSAPAQLAALDKELVGLRAEQEEILAGKLRP